MRGKNLVFRNKSEVERFIEALRHQIQLWTQESESPQGEVSFLDFGFSNEHKREMLRRGLIFGKRKRGKAAG